LKGLVLGGRDRIACREDDQNQFFENLSWPIDVGGVRFSALKPQLLENYRVSREGKI
jgi:hypothetical protein